MSPGEGAGAQLTATTAVSVGTQAPARDFGPLTTADVRPLRGRVR